MNEKIACIRSVSRGRKNSAGSCNVSNSMIAFLPRTVHASTVNIVASKTSNQTPKNRSNECNQSKSRKSLH